MFEIWTKRVSTIKLSSMRIANGFARLPAEYQEVEYIESSWTQYIATWYNPKTTTEFEIEYEIVSYNQRYCVPMWTRKDHNLNAYYFWYENNNNSYYGFWNNKADPSSVDFHWVWVKRKITYHNNILSNWTQSVTVATNQQPYWNIVIFWEEHNWNVQELWVMKIYMFKLREWNDLIRDFVPCYRVLDWVIWLYDLANGQFYSNVWTWTFVKWRDIMYGINSHTLRYYPFASNVADRAGQWATGTVNGTVTYSDNWIAVSWDSGYVTWMTNWIANRDTYTQIFRARYSSFPDNYWLLIWDSSNYNTNSSFALELWGSSGTNNVRYYNFSWSTDVLWSAQWDIPSDTYFHLYVITADNGVYKMYRDGELVCTGESSWVTINDKPNMNLWRSSYYWSQREWYGEIKDYIVEDRPRDAERIREFYAMYNCIDLVSTVETTRTLNNNQYFYWVNITTKKTLKLKWIKFYWTTGWDVSGTLRITFWPYADSPSYNEFSISSVNSLQDYIYRFNSPYDLASWDTISISFKVSDTGRLLMNNNWDITFPVDWKNVTFNYWVHTASTNGQNTTYSYGIKWVITWG